MSEEEEEEEMMVITKDVLKREIDYIQDQYIETLYTIIKAFEFPRVRRTVRTSPTTDEQWSAFLNHFAGICAESPLQRGEQGQYEAREALL